ncbi:MAG: condensation protein [Pedobacter sp.]|nr:MAG: condensation protein [Pedobacter sp.]
MEKKQNRTLGAFEKTFWLLDQIDSKDFALAAEIEGVAPIEKWKIAIEKVQQRHPNLSVRVVMDELHRPVIEHVENLPIPFRVINAHPGYRWEQEVEHELSERFDTAKGPLVRIRLVQKPDSTVLIVAANHTLADGTSLSYLIRDLLSAVNGKELEVYHSQISNDQILGLPDDQPILTSKNSSALKENSKSFNPRISSLRISTEATNQLLKKAREEGTTVHGAICAAVLIAGRKLRSEWSDVKMELVTPICTRGALNLDDNFGLNITTHSGFFENEQKLPFWELARFVKSGLEGTNSKKHVSDYLHFFRELTFGHNDTQKMLDVLKEAFNHQIMVTNLVRVKYDTDFGDLQLKSLYGPMVRSGKGMEQTVGAVSTNGSLSLTNTSDNPIDGLLEAIEELLAEASGLDGDLPSNPKAYKQRDQSCPL